MLGPALTDLLQSLAHIPDPERTPEQRALLQELALLFAVSAEPADHLVALQKTIRSHLNLKELGTLKLTRPKPKSTRKCSCCGQSLP